MSNWGDCSDCENSIVIPAGEKGDNGTAVSTVLIVTAPTATVTTTTTTSTGTVDVGHTTVLLDRAAGSTVTLPNEPEVGTIVEFEVVTSVTTNDYIVQVSSAGTDSFDGAIFGMKASTSPELFILSADSTMTMNGTTSGGLIGTSFKLVYSEVGTWRVSGNFYGSGVLIIPFA